MRKKRKKIFVKEKHCLNCNAVLHGNFCAECGQKAFLDKDNFFHLTYHFAADYFHYDGKFLNSVKALFTHPGKITREFITGKRKKYLHPIQMYLFVSALFFLVIIYCIDQNKMTRSVDDIKRMRLQTEHIRDSIFKHAEYEQNPGFAMDDHGFIINNKVSSTKQYDSIEESLPLNKRENKFHRTYHRKLLSVNDKTYDVMAINEKYNHMIIVTISKAFFVLLPYFAFITFLFFRKYPYVDHIIFSLHFHVAAYLFLFFLTISEIYLTFNNRQYIIYFILAGLFLYLYKSLHSAYQQSYLITFLKTIGISLLYCTSLFFTFLLVLYVTILLL